MCHQSMDSCFHRTNTTEPRSKSRNSATKIELEELRYIYEISLLVFFTVRNNVASMNSITRKGRESFLALCIRLLAIVV
jgi:hypothetical protein